MGREPMDHNEKPTLVFMGTPDFAAASLNHLAPLYDIRLVVSQPDRPRGRGKRLQPSPVKALAMELGIPVRTPELIGADAEVLEELTKIQPDFIIVVAYGQILPKEILELPTYGCINLHASLLPAYRGAAPVQEAILRGDLRTGNTTMLMDEGLDTGHILLQEEIEVPETMTTGELFDRLEKMGPKLLEDTVSGLIQGSISPVPQPLEGVSYVSKITKKDAEIDFDKPSREILNLIRGMHPAPLAYSFAGEIMVKIHKAELAEASGEEAPGTILKQDKNGILVKTRDGAITIKELQLPGKKPMAVRDFLNGNRIEPEKFTRSDRF